MWFLLISVSFWLGSCWFLNVFVLVVNRHVHFIVFHPFLGYPLQKGFKKVSAAVLPCFMFTFSAAVFNLNGYNNMS